MQQANLWLPGFDPVDGLFANTDTTFAAASSEAATTELAKSETTSISIVEITQTEQPACELSLCEEISTKHSEETIAQSSPTTVTARKAGASSALRTSPPWPELGADVHEALKGVVSKFEANVKAIEVLRQLEESSATPDDAQRKTLNQYTGWGGIKQPFDVNVHTDWTKRAVQLKGLLSEAEFTSAKESTLNAHFTPVSLIKSIWKVLRQLGFSGGRVLEPAGGAGYFLGSMPSDIAQASTVTAVEIDTLSARILKALYGHEARVIHSGFEKAMLGDGTFDLVVSNVPFGKYGVPDLRRKYYSDWTIHNYFIGRSLDLVRPGGLVAVITSAHFMDSDNQKRRDALSRRAKLVAAFRFPAGMFGEIASTDVMADLIILQRRQPGEYATQEEFDSWVPCETLMNSQGKPLRMYEERINELHSVNSYWLDNPEHVLGRWDLKSGHHGIRLTVDAPDIEDVVPKLETAVSKMQTEVFEAIMCKETKVDLQVGDEEFNVMLPGSFVVIDGDIFRTTGYNVIKQPMKPTRARRVAGLAGIRDTVRQLLAEQNKLDASQDVMDSLRERLNSLYDGFISKFDCITNRQNRLAMSSDPSWPLLLSLEFYDEEANSATKADIFFERTIRPTAVPTSADTPEDALAICVAELGTIDLTFIGNLLARDGQQAVEDLISLGAVFIDPVNGDYLTASEYLSGNVREKCTIAKQAGLEYQRNWLALESVIPADLGPTEIDVIPGAVWIGGEDYEAFLKELMAEELVNSSWATITVTRDAAAGAWSVKGALGHGPTMTKIWGTDRANGYILFESLLNLADMEIKDPDGDGGYRINPVETANARQKQDELKEKFRSWLWIDDERAKRLARYYNDTFNCWANRKYDGSRLRLPGYSNNLTLRDHQLNGVARIATGENTLLAHVVGAGKTLEMVCGSMELRRLGIIKKPAHVVPNHMLMQYTAEFCRAYPGAKVLMATKEDFDKSNRKAFVARCAVGNFDAIIMTHSMFERIGCDKEFVEGYVKGIIADLTSTDKNRDRTAERAMVRLKKDWTSRLEKMQASWKKDNLIFWHETGIDAIFYDEMHMAKNLFRLSSMKQVAGLSSSNSQRSFDLFLKTRQLMAMNGDKERGVVGATGTPISNSMAEAHTFMRYMQPYTLASVGMDHFDAWSAQYGRIVNSLEVSPDGSSFRMNKRYKMFVNMPELMGMMRQFMDVQTKEMLNLPTPPLVTGAHQICVAEASDVVKEYVKNLVERAEKIRNKQVRPEEDNMLAITGDGMRAALDMRLVGSGYEFDEKGKVALCISKVHELWERTASFKGTQIIFSDLGTPTGNGFNLYADIRRRLVQKGIPEHEVAFIHEAPDDAAKSNLFAKVRSGAIRVLIGSTAKCGMGTNVQKLLYAVHHLTTPWRPSDIEQRDGRIERQGNTCEAIEIWKYVTSGTFDSYMWQTLTSKASFIAQIMSDKAESRTVEDAMMSALSYDEVKALACGNPRVREKAMIDAEILMLGLKERQHRDAVWNARNELWDIPNRVAIAKEKAVKYGTFYDELVEAAKSPWSLVINGSQYSDRGQIEKIITLSIATFNEERHCRDQLIGDIAGGSLYYRPKFGDSHEIVLRAKSSDIQYLFGGYSRGSTVLDKLIEVQGEISDKFIDQEARVTFLNDQQPVLTRIVASEFQDVQKLAELRAKSKEIAMEMGLLKDIDGTAMASQDSVIASPLAQNALGSEEAEDVTESNEDGSETESLTEMV